MELHAQCSFYILNKRTGPWEFIRIFIFEQISEMNAEMKIDVFIFEHIQNVKVKIEFFIFEQISKK